MFITKREGKADQMVEIVKKYRWKYLSNLMAKGSHRCAIPEPTGAGIDKENPALEKSRHKV